jgi:hypothetical protein
MKDEWRHRLDEGLMARGYQLEYPEETSESFGSWYRDYGRSGKRIRLIWDGRDQWFVLQDNSKSRDLAIKTPKDLANEGVEEFLRFAD